MLVSQTQSICIIYICGGCHPEGFIVASFYNLNIANNQYNNNNDSNNISSYNKDDNNNNSIYTA